MSFRFAKSASSAIASDARAQDLTLRGAADVHRGLAARTLHGRGRPEAE